MRRMINIVGLVLISILVTVIVVNSFAQVEIQPEGDEIYYVKKIYVVKKGDTPEKIAQKLGVPGYKLLEWNPEMGCRFIYVGQGLIYKTKGEFEKGLKELETETKKETKKLKNEIEKGLKELEAKRTRNYTRAFKRQNC